MKNWKINKTYLGFRIITFPIKLVFTIFWYILLSLMHSLRWLICGGQELLYGTDSKESLVKIIEQNEEIIKHFKDGKK